MEEKCIQAHNLDVKFLLADIVAVFFIIFSSYYHIFKIIIFRDELSTFPRISNGAEKWRELLLICKLIQTRSMQWWFPGLEVFSNTYVITFLFIAEANDPAPAKLITSILKL